MSSRAWIERIQDILGAINEIKSFTQEIDFAAFSQDLRTVRAVELNFIIIGEAVNGIPEEVQERHPEILWHFMRALRNRLVHVYFSVDAQVIWDTIQNDLPPLEQQLKALVA